MEMLLLILIYFGLSNWIQIKFLIGNIFKKSSNKEVISLDRITESVNKKTKLKLTILLLPEKTQMIGFMVSSPPFKPVMMFSEKLLKEFNYDELEWVVLHEAAHYLMWHNYKLIISNIVFFILGIGITITFSLPIYISSIILIIFAITYIQFAKIFEYEADRYSISHVDNPEGVISGNIKMRNNNNILKSLKNTIFTKLLIIAVPYDERIKTAKEEIEKRNH